ncbi:MAG: ATP-binding protein [Aeromonadaceae bacterium]
MAPLNTVISWSSGKDSALTLLRLQADPRYRVIGLYTTHVGDGVPFQHTPLPLVQAQAAQLGLPLITIALPESFPPNPLYQRCVVQGLKASQLAIDAVAFGDMFCNGIADYRRSYIEPAGWHCLFPLLGIDSRALAQEIVMRGIQTRIATVDTQQLDGRFCGRYYSSELIAELPDMVDPCGENGEFHTLVTDMPGFAAPLCVRLDGIDRTGRFHYQRYLLPDSA